MRKAPADVPLPRSPTAPAMFLAAVQMGIWEVRLQTTLCLDCRAFVSFDRSLPMTACLAKALVTGQLAGLSCEAVAGVVVHCHVSAFPPAPPHCLHACYFAVLPPRKSICHWALMRVFRKPGQRVIAITFFLVSLLPLYHLEFIFTQWSTWSCKKYIREDIPLIKTSERFVTSLNKTQRPQQNPQDSLVWSQPVSLSDHTSCSFPRTLHSSLRVSCYNNGVPWNGWFINNRN